MNFTFSFTFLMMVVSHLTILEWTDTMYVYLYVQVAGFIKKWITEPIYVPVCCHAKDYCHHKLLLHETCNIVYYGLLWYQIF